MVVPLTKIVERKMYFNDFLPRVCPDGDRRLQFGLRGYDTRLRHSGSWLPGPSHVSTVVKHTRVDGNASLFTYFTLLCPPYWFRGWRESERHACLFLASLVHSLRLHPVQSLILSAHWARGLPLGRLPCIFPSRMFLIIDGCRLVCPK